MDEQREEIERGVLVALYEAWTKDTNTDLYSVIEAGGWDKVTLEEVFEDLEENRRFISSPNQQLSNYDITADGIIYAEDQEFVPKSERDKRRQARLHALLFLEELYKKSGKTGEAHIDEIAQGAAIARFDMDRELVVLRDLGFIRNTSSTSFAITKEGREYLQSGPIQ